MNNKKIVGVTCGILTGVGWGLSGIFSQYLFSGTSMEPGWFVAVRMIVSGMALMCYGICTNRKELKRLCANKKDLLICVAAGILGNMLFQLSCYSAVKESNAPTAIVLQYLCPVMIIVFVCIRKRKLPKTIEIISILLAVSGVFIISTHGKIDQLVLTPKALIFGIGTAFFMSLGSIIPEKLYKVYSVQSITGIMLTAGGIVACITIRPWCNVPKMDVLQICALLGAIVVGSVLSYIFYANAIRDIGSAKASLCACAEIPAATILAVVFLENSFLWIDFIGFVLIASTIFLTSLKK